MNTSPPSARREFLKVRTSPNSPERQAGELEIVLKEIDDLIGLEGVKQELNKLIAYARVVALRRERDIDTTSINLHMVFTGPPGTGKTEVARKVGRVLKAIGLLKRGHCVEVDRGSLVASYAGQTAPTVKEKVKDALDGVLFIDEAYQLSGGKNLQGPDPMGQEAIDTLLKQMEDYRDRLVVIAAGYTSEMRRFVESNTGLKSRFSKFIEFSTYGTDDLVAIFESMVAKGKYHLTDAALHEGRKYIRDISKAADENFGNAREVRKFYERILLFQAERLGFDPDLEKIDNQQLLTLEADDVKAAAEHY